MEEKCDSTYAASCVQPEGEDLMLNAFWSNQTQVHKLQPAEQRSEAIYRLYILYKIL